MTRARSSRRHVAFEARDEAMELRTKHADAGAGGGFDAGVLEGRPHRRRGESDTESGEFSVDATVTPRRVLGGEADDGVSDLKGGPGPARPMRVRPVVRDETSMPRQDRVGFHQEDRPTGTIEHTRECREDRPIGWLETGMSDLARQYRELMAQHEDLGILRPVPATAEHQQVDHESDETVATGHPRILIDPKRPDQIATRNPKSRRRMSFRHRQDPAWVAAMVLSAVAWCARQVGPFGPSAQ
jgi:hypothetical protein